MLRSVDLFTGIGGFVHGLDGIATPVLYCDSDKHVQTYLKGAMSGGILPTAPIADDVRDVDSIKSLLNGARVDLITAGFPCVGFSTAGKREGLNNSESSLFKDALILIGSLSPRAVLFENVKTILSHQSDMNYICRSMSDLGYEVSWTVISAKEVGAPHIRSRWFCLCVQAGGNPPFEIDVPVVMKNTWASGPPPLVCNNWSNRQPFHMLGNAVVPSCVRDAFVQLISSSTSTSGRMKYTPLKQRVNMKQVKGIKYPKTGCYVDGTCYEVTVSRTLSEPMKITLDPLHKVSSCISTCKSGEKMASGVRVYSLFPTPRKTCVYHTRHLCSRTSRDLGTFVLYVSSINGIRLPKTSDETHISLKFVTWLMGFPLNTWEYYDA